MTITQNPVPGTQNIKFNKTETEYNMKSIRFLLLTITTMFIIIAGLMIALGVSVYSHYHGFSYFYESGKIGRFLTPSVFCVILGVVILAVTSIGFCGSLKQSTCMVNMYALILTIILIVKLVVVILAFTVNAGNVMKYLEIPVWRYADDPEIQGEIDHLQLSLSCCGSSSYLDYIGVPFTTNHSTALFHSEIEGDLVAVVVPTSCCATTLDYICIRLRSNGCTDALVNVIVQNSTVLGVLGVSVMFIELLGIIFALLLARCIRKMKSERAFISWRIKEQMILARKEQEQAQEADTVYIVQPDSSTA